MKKANRCNSENLKRNEVPVATLIELVGAFLVLLLGTLLSLVVLILEKISSYCWILKRLSVIQ